MRRLSGVLACVTVGLAVAACLPEGLAQGKLDSFAADVAGRGYAVGDSAGTSRSCLGEFFGEVFSDLIGVTLAGGGACSWARVAGGGGGDMPLREIGAPTIPFVRMDVGYQFVESDVDAVVKAGIGG
jgi:hypothetical protein